MLHALLFSLLALFWGGSFVAIKNLIHDVPSTTGAFYRVFFSVLFLVLIYNRKIRITKIKNLKEIFASGITGLCLIGIPFSLLFWGEKFISPSIAGVLNGTVPIWATLISIMLFNGKQDITKLKMLGIMTGFGGLCIIFLPKIKLNGDMNEIYGLIAVLGMAIFYGLGTNFSKHLVAKNKEIIGQTNVFIQQVFALIYLTVLMLINDGLPDFTLLSNPSIGASVLYLSLLSTTVAFIIFHHLIAHYGPVKTSTVTFFIPPVSLLIDNVFYGTKLSSYEIIGALIILSSMYLMRDKVIKGS